MTQNFDRFKFRIWCPKQKRMLKNLTIWQNGDREDITIQGAGQINSHNLGVRFASFDYTPPILMQCAGLKDKNEKLIYEGDILKWNDTTGSEKDGTLKRTQMQGFVVYDEQSAAFYIKSKNSVSGIGMDSQDVLGFNQDEWEGYIKASFDWAVKNLRAEIIGDIYQNPELINK